jgi:hypothetical protein
MLCNIILVGNQFHFNIVIQFYISGIGGAGVVAIYKLAFPPASSEKIPVKLSNGTIFKSDLIFEEIRERASEVLCAAPV